MESKMTENMTLELSLDELGQVNGGAGASVNKTTLGYTEKGVLVVSTTTQNGYTVSTARWDPY
jgi:hypothetical protein